MPVVISDASPLICLRHLGLTDVLRGLYGIVLLPPAVLCEYAKLTGVSEPLLLAEAPFLTVDVRRDDSITPALEGLDTGESDAMRLAFAVHADLLLVDDLDARRVAQKLGLKIVGTVRILMMARNADLVGEVVPLLRRLQSERDLRLSESVLRTVREELGE